MIFEQAGPESDDGEVRGDRHGRREGCRGLITASAGVEGQKIKNK